MHKPDGTASGPQHHHYALHLAHLANCEWTCQAHLPSTQRTGRGLGAHKHTDPNLHAHIAEIKTLPNSKRTAELALALRAELTGSNHLPAHVYSAIWGQVHAVLTHLDVLPDSAKTLGPAFDLLA